MHLHGGNERKGKGERREREELACDTLVQEMELPIHYPTGTLSSFTPHSSLLFTKTQSVLTEQLSGLLPRQGVVVLMRSVI